MYRLNTGGTLGPDEDPFPSVAVTMTLPGAFGDEDILSGTVHIQLGGALGPGEGLSQTVTSAGVYYSLDGHTRIASDQPVQPRFYANVTASGLPGRSVLLISASYETLDTPDPLIAAPVNDELTQTVEAVFDQAGWYPAVPATLQGQGEETGLVIQMGQYDPVGQKERLYSEMELDLYYSLSADQLPPDVTVVDGILDARTGQVSVKVGATDPAGVQRAVATYTQGDGSWRSVELHWDADSFKWVGSFTGSADTQYMVQVVDGAGNTAYETNGGLYFTPAVDPLTMYAVYLPLVARNN
jgi:hypothetical protein